MHKVIIADTSCFILLFKIDELDLLKAVYGTIVTTPDIADEFGQILPQWIQVVSPKDTQVQHVLELQVDKGEASAIALAMETANVTLILDDYKARKLALKLGIDITGTLGIIIKAKINGIIPSVIPYVNKIKQTDFRLSAELETQVYKEAGETMR